MARTATIDRQTAETKIELTLDNVLETSVANGGSAAIKKKQFGLRITPIPEPSSLILGMIGLVGLMILARLKRYHEPFPWWMAVHSVVVGPGNIKTSPGSTRNGS